MKFFGEELAIKLLEVIFEKGIGAIAKVYYQSWKDKKVAIDHIRTHESIEKEKVLSNERLAQFKEDINSISKNLEISNDTADNLPTLTAIENSIQNKRISEEKRVAEAIYHSINFLIENSDIDIDENLESIGNLNKDWLLSWESYVSKVSDVDMQILWGRVLAKEFLRPGEYSLRTMNYLKNLSKEEASLIEKVAPFVTGYGLIFSANTSKKTLALAEPNDFMEKFSFSNDEFSLLEEIGIITGVSTLGNIIELAILDNNTDDIVSLLHIDKSNYLGFISNESKKQISYSFFPLTKLGREILTLVEHDKNEEYIEWLAEPYKEYYELKHIVVN